MPRHEKEEVTHLAFTSYSDRSSPRFGMLTAPLQGALQLDLHGARYGSLLQLSPTLYAKSKRVLHIVKNIAPEGPVTPSIY